MEKRCKIDIIDLVELTPLCMFSIAGKEVCEVPGCSQPACLDSGMCTTHMEERSQNPKICARGDCNVIVLNTRSEFCEEHASVLSVKKASVQRCSHRRCSKSTLGDTGLCAAHQSKRSVHVKKCLNSIVAGAKPADRTTV